MNEDLEEKLRNALNELEEQAAAAFEERSSLSTKISELSAEIGAKDDEIYHLKQFIEQLQCDCELVKKNYEDAMSSLQVQTLWLFFINYFIHSERIGS